jgi:hypothetical protein
MIQRLLLSVILGWALFTSGLMSCGTNGPGGEVTNTEESGSDTTVATAGGTTGSIEPSTGGTTAEDTTGGSGPGGTTTATGGTATTGGTGTAGTTTGGGTGTGGSGSGGTLTLTGGASICITHPIICEGFQPVEVPGLTGGSPIGGPAVGQGGVGDYPAPDAMYKVTPGIDVIKRFGQQGIIASPVVQEDLIHGGTFTAPDGFVMSDGITKAFAKGTVVTVTKEGVATATTPDGVVENLPSDATLIFTGGAAVTRTGSSAFTLQPGHAVRFGAGNFQIFQSGIGGMKAPAVERQFGH